ncbi:DNA repair protein XRCC2 homolog isoform X3 [Camellia sinensis]|uniref:DNA repair protein XRCC2 homolog isoform X3 n=1 Tax=Camellia sinensis TaxID=4442 RepID=UPI001035E616|nr:DNA repair protein XRCC2 homolog isoform X3 [Camellia sinensis]
MEEEVEEVWIEGEESAKAMLERVLRERPLLLLLPPLHRVPLRFGNVVELLGPSPSAKTHILIQAAVSCILPKEWNGVTYGGLEHLVMFIDLDCRFDVLRLSQSLRHRIMEANGSRVGAMWEQKDADFFNNSKEGPCIEYDKELFDACMRRFLYVRCYDSSEFLATLKTLHYQLRKEREKHGVDVHFLMIDSIGAFYWIDRASTSLAVMGNNRKSHSLQTVSETVVLEIRKLLQVYPMLVLATKAASLGDKYSTSEAKRNSRKWCSANASDSGPQNLLCREYMPSIWQSFVTHRVLVRPSGLAAGNCGLRHAPNYDSSKHQNYPIYWSEWLLPSLSILDKFIVTDVGVFTIP